MAKYSLSNFLPTPSVTEKRIKILDKNSVCKYTIDPNISYFFSKANLVIIKIEDKNDISLDFTNSTEAIQALAKLNELKKKLTIVVVEPTTPTDPSNPISTTSLTYSKSNLNMMVNETINDGDLACSTPINSRNKSIVKVKVNGVDVNVGGKVYPYDCYFSNDNGVTVRNVGDEKYGDLLYWNKSIAGYNLDVQDIIDFDYLVDII